MAKNLLQHDICLSQRVIVPKPDDPKAFRFKDGCSFCITRLLFGMLPAVELHDQLLFKADEIHDVRWNRMLPPKLESAEVAVFQMQPKPQFRIGC